MKYVIIISDGAADFPVHSLGHKTPLEVANIPGMDFIAKNGKTGLMQTSFPELPVGSIVANMGVLGFNPLDLYPNGRASFEALAKGIKLGSKDVAFRCNLISLEGDRIKDFTAGMISEEDALNIVNNFKIKYKNMELYFGQSYRNTLVLRNVNFFAHELQAFEPHEHIGMNIKEIFIRAKEPNAEDGVDMLNSFLMDSIEQIKELNKKFNTKADMFWLWSPSSTPKLPSFKKKFGLNGAVVSGMDFLQGIGIDAGMTAEHIPGTNGYITTNFKGKLEYAKKYLKNHDFVFIHLNAPDEEAHQRTPETKVKAIEKVDEEIIVPILDYLALNYPNDFRIAVLPDHYTLLKDGTHNNIHVPYAVYGKGIEKDKVDRFTEDEIEENHEEVLVGCKFLEEEFFLNK